MKGDSGTAVVVVIVIVIAIAAIFLLSGSGFNFGSQGIVYSNDVVSVTNKFVFDKAPYEGQETSVEFAVKNNGRGEVKDILLSIEPPTGFTSEILNRCEDGGTQWIGNPSWCFGGSDSKFDYEFNLEEGDAKFVMINLEAISGITQIIPVNFRYSISYPYGGEREFHIPIVQNRDELPKGQTYFISDSTYGPIQIDVVPPASRETADGGFATYMISGTQMKFDFTVNNIGSSDYGTVLPVVMSGDDLQLTLTNLEIVFCDKMEQKSSSSNVLVLKDVYINEGDLASGGVTLRTPFDVKCVLQATPGEGVRDGIVKFDVKYMYKILFSDYFNIIPRGVPKVEPVQTSDSSIDSSSESSSTEEVEEDTTVCDNEVLTEAQKRACAKGLIE